MDGRSGYSASRQANYQGEAGVLTAGTYQGADSSCTSSQPM